MQAIWCCASQSIIFRLEASNEKKSIAHAIAASLQRTYHQMFGARNRTINICSMHCNAIFRRYADFFRRSLSLHSGFSSNILLLMRSRFVFFPLQSSFIDPSRVRERYRGAIIMYSHRYFLLYISIFVVGTLSFRVLGQQKTRWNALQMHCSLVILAVCFVLVWWCDGCPRSNGVNRKFTI